MKKSTLDLASKYYDLVYAQKEDINFYVKMVSECKGPVLEAGCGTGRILTAIASLGYEITGLDLSKNRLDLCHFKIEQLENRFKKKVDIYNGNMVNFKLNKKFKTVLIPFRGIQFITNPEEQLQALKCFAKHLQNRGFLILDAFNPDINKLTGKSIFKGRKTLYNCLEGEKLAVVEKIKSMCYIKQLITVEENYIVTAPGRISGCYTHTYTMRYLFRYEIEYMLRLAGFTINNIFSDFHGTSWGNDDAENIVIVAQKNNKTITR